MTLELTPILVRVLGVVLAVVVNSIIVAASKHPELKTGVWAQLLRALGRASLLRHTNSPGTLHPFCFCRQPAPELTVGEPLRTRWTKPPATPLLLLVLALGLSGCVQGLATAQRSLASAVDEQTRTLAAFSAWDAAHQMELVRGSKTREEAQQQLAAYREKRKPLVDLLKSSAQALDTAAVSLQGVGAAPAPGSVR